MGQTFCVNSDGSITNAETKTINNIDWMDHKNFKGKWSALQIIIHIICLFSILGSGILVLSWCGIRLKRGYWPFFGIRAIENTPNFIKVFCNNKGQLGLYTKKHRITSAKYTSVQQISGQDYPVFILGENGKYSLYNHTQSKFRFKDSDNIVYLNDKTILVEQNGQSNKYSLIGMPLD